MLILDHRLQLLISAEQRRRLEAEARERGKSIGQLIREAIDARYGSVTREDRIRAAREIGQARRGRFLTPEELDRIVGEERLANFPEVLRPRRR